ncbi:hypothetical protein HH308_22415 [Gordonia sp. TBRC 11910]|uniref:Serine/threonine protein kinase n=1 Tax=Gordonia asplenii TaxID=2725283 RepID=A0A848L5P5_9ACTN|nr:hypothetical protein [Gordonia asplenii]NMO03973.1 hypothetical protein [Gordonia asplenii]
MSRHRIVAAAATLCCVAFLSACGLTGDKTPVTVTKTEAAAPSSTTAASPPAVTTATTVTVPGPVQTAPAAPPGPAPGGGAPASSQCDSTVGVGSSSTSCPFATAVRTAYLNSGAKGQSRQVSVVSPVTGQSYLMSCSPQGSAVVCTGGNNAVVVIY